IPINHLSIPFYFSTTIFQEVGQEAEAGKSNILMRKAKTEIIKAMLKISVFVQQCKTIQYLSFNLPTIQIHVIYIA
uniref:Uncharacterized protein n=1 Tax=Amphimedon queenslandica TaxID=400682 RepID=A0A1X7UXV7_AMPQE